MWRKKITLWLLSDRGSESKQITVPLSVLYAAPGFVLLLTILTFFLLSEFFGNRVNESEIDRLKAENQFLTDKYEGLKTMLSDVESRFSQLVEKEIAIRKLFSLPEIDLEERQLGTGGPAPIGFASMSSLEQSTLASESEVDRLVKLSQFELVRFAEIENALTTLKDRLDCTPSITPAQGWRSRGYGMHHDPFTGNRQLHKGIDIANNTGTPIVASARGKVVFAGRDPGGLGNLVVIDHGRGYLTRYGHLSKILVRSGVTVERNARIALMGSTGYSTGPHLHYEVWKNGTPVDPENFMLDQR